MSELIPMTRIEAEWLVAWALVHKGVMRAKGFNSVISECPLNVGRDLLMKKCRKCGREYYMDCPDCTFRHGGTIPETDALELEGDLVDQMTDLATDPGYYLENALAWMRVQRTDSI